MRRAMHPAMETLGTPLIEDVSVPRSALPDMFDEIARIERQYGLVIPAVAHAGDGNLHPNFVFEGPEVPPVVWEAAEELFRAALALGGTLTVSTASACSSDAGSPWSWATISGPCNETSPASSIPSAS